MMNYKLNWPKCKQAQTQRRRLAPRHRHPLARQSSLVPPSRSSQSDRKEARFSAPAVSKCLKLKITQVLLKSNVAGLVKVRHLQVKVNDLQLKVKCLRVNE